MNNQIELYAIAAALKELVELNEEHRPGIALLLKVLAKKLEDVAAELG